MSCLYTSPFQAEVSRADELQRRLLESERERGSEEGFERAIASLEDQLAVCKELSRVRCDKAKDLEGRLHACKKQVQVSDTRALEYRERAKNAGDRLHACELKLKESEAKVKASEVEVESVRAHNESLLANQAKASPPTSKASPPTSTSALASPSGISSSGDLCKRARCRSAQVAAAAARELFSDLKESRASTDELHKQVGELDRNLEQSQESLRWYGRREYELAEEVKELRWELEQSKEKLEQSEASKRRLIEDIEEREEKCFQSLARSKASNVQAREKAHALAQQVEELKSWPVVGKKTRRGQMPFPAKRSKLETGDWRLEPEGSEEDLFCHNCISHEHGTDACPEESTRCYDCGMHRGKHGTHCQAVAARAYTWAFA